MLLFFLGTEHIDELVSTIMQRLDVNDVERPMILVCFILLQFILPFERILYVFIIMLTFSSFLV